ncbi:MAG: succinate CoA transferase [Polyangiales bacterium]
MSFPILTADEAAASIDNGATLAFSGFTPAGSPKTISRALAAKAEQEHRGGRDFKVAVLTGASTGPSIDGALARAHAIATRTPYQSDPDLRHAINSGQVRFLDMHLSQVAQNARYGFFGPIDVAIIEACDLDAQGRAVLTTGVGCAPTWVRLAKRVFIERNRRHPATLCGMHDLFEPADPPHRREIPIYEVRNRIGSERLTIAAEKIAGIIETDLDDESDSFRSPDAETTRIGANVAAFLAGELKRGHIPAGFLPLQSGVGQTANAVLEALSTASDIPPYEMYTEVIQDAVLRHMREGNIRFASGSSLTVSAEARSAFYDDLNFFRERILLRPQEITNHPEVVRRLGVISCNTAIEVDLFGNVNSTHLLGETMMNGIGGSGDFTRNAYISIFVCNSTRKGGKISTIVPRVSHVDHNEHSVQVVATEWGVADLRGRAPQERARLIIERCAHPDFRDQLRECLAKGGLVHTPQSLHDAFSMHERFLRSGDMHRT